MMSLPSTDTSKYVLWGLQLLFGLLITLGTMLFSAQTGRIEQLEREVSALRQPVYQTQENVKNLNEWLNRMESKIDDVLSQYRRTP